MRDLVKMKMITFNINSFSDEKFAVLRPHVS
jgi:hypothetical protein